MSQRKKATIDTAFMQKHTAGGPLDIDEVSFLIRYGERTSVQSTPEREQAPQSRPLIDNVKPQPKAFFAYLQKPATSRTNTASSTRIARPRRRKIQ